MFNCGTNAFAIWWTDNGKFENFDGYESYKLNWHIQIEDIKKTLAKWNEDTPMMCLWNCKSI
jgi:hypothetical protein